MMKNKIKALLFIFAIVLTGCGNENNTSPTGQDNVQGNQSQSSKETTASKKPSEPSFNRSQVLNDYGDIPLEVLDVSERNKNGRNSLTVTLSVPLDPSLDHQEYFSVSIKGKKVVDGAWVTSKSGKIIWFPFIEPDTTYEVTIYSGLTAANGQSLHKTRISQIKSNQLTPSVNFESSGAFLTQGLGNGLPVVTVNVKEVDINFYKVGEKNIQRFLQEMTDHRYYWGIDTITQFGKLAYSGRYELNAPKNTRVKRSIDIEGISELKQPGIYLAVMTKAGAYDNHQMMWYSVTDIGLHARFYDNQLDVYASSLKTGKALNSTKISLVNSKGEILQQSVTSPVGQASFVSSLNSASLIVAKSDKNFSVIEINKPALDLSDFDLGLRPSRPQELFIYAPRDLYRPGEFVDFNALLRNADGRLTGNRILGASIKSPDGTKIKTFKWNGNQQNYYHYNWQIPVSAQLGTWQFEVKNIGSESFTFDFKVEEFLPERLKLTFNPNSSQNRPVVTKNEKLSLAVLGEYLFGAPAAGNRLSTDVSISAWRKPVKSLPRFEFGDIRQTEFTQRHALEDIQLDDKGRGEITYKNDWSRLHSPLRVKFISSLYESGGRPISRTHSGLVWPSKKMLGIRSSFGDENPEANSKVSFEIVKSSIDGVKHKAKDLDVKLIREDRRYFWVYSQDQGWHYEWTDNEFVEFTKSLDIDEGEIGQIEFPVAWGNYRVEVRDPTNNLLTSKQFYAGWNWYEKWQNSQSGSGAARPDKITMALDKKAYSAGGTVKVNVIPPQAGEAIVMVESDELLWMKRLFIPAEGKTVEIPVSADWQQHNIYISTVVLQPGDQLKNLTPKRSFGLVHLPLQRDSRKLEVEFDVAEKALPNKTLPVKVKVQSLSTEHSLNKQPQKLFVTLAAVDVGVLNISNFKTPDPHTAFFGQRRYGVDSRDVYHRVIEISQAEKARLRFGGDSDLTRGGKEPQSDVQIVSLFSGLVPLDNLGEATIPVDIPDFNGRLRLMALAFSADKFGQSEQDVTIAAPIVTQIAMPRFLAMGDKTTIAIDVTNLSEQTQDLAIKFTGSGPIKQFDNSKKVSLKNGEKTTLRYQIEALGFKGQAKFSLKVTGKDLPDDINREWFLGLRPAYPATLTTTQKILHQGENLALDKNLINSLFPETIQASVGISPKANIDLQEQLTGLLQYPYGCLEQTSSRAYPLIFATPNKQKLMGLTVIDENKRLDMINKGIERLAMLQLGNGGYGLWDNRSYEEHWLTAYVADFLLNARDMGISVPDEMISKTLKRLQTYLTRSSRFYDERWSDDAKHYYFAYKAYSAYVLARVNQVPLGNLRSLAKNHSRFARTGLSQMHLAIALSKMGDNKLADKLLKQSLNNLPKKRQQYLADYGSQIRDLSLMIHLMLTHDLEKKKAIALSFTLAELLNKRNYLSTQERNALFLAGSSLKAFDGETWTAELILGSLQTKLNQTSSYQNNLTPKTLHNKVNIISHNTHPLLASISINGYTKEPPKESSNGLSVQRRWLNLKGEEINLQQANVGDLFLVHLQITAEQRTPDALVIDLLPAGFELENQNLEHSIKQDEIIVDGRSITQWQNRNLVNHQEYRDDRYVAAIEVNKGRAINLFYLTRAVTPGKYKVPSPLVEDMYRPEIRGIGKITSDITIVQKAVNH